MMIRSILLTTIAGAMLASGVQAADPTPTAAASDSVLDDSRIICRKTLDTGSLVRKTKQCFTRAEWDRIAQQTRVGNQKLADQLSGACGMAGGVCP